MRYVEPESFSDIMPNLPEGPCALATAAEKWDALTAISSGGKRKHEREDAGQTSRR